VISLSLEEMVRNETLDTAQAEVLKEIIQNKENFVILGGTGSGKTTLLKAMLSQVSDERIITIEDAAELFLLGRSVSLTTRSNNHEGVGEITLARLLREALRMRPDRLVIGETRGEELLLLLQAMNTGHSGSGFTIHANTMHDFIPRVLAIMAGIGISPELTKVLVNSAINWVVEVQRLNGKRKVTNIRRLSELNV
jgi:pilus assembly protein CpaF